VNIPRCSLSIWKNLYDAADAFREIACWEWMSDSDLFGVQNPESGEIGYCCVLGELGEVFGLVSYLGSLGLEQHHKIQSGKLHARSPDLPGSQSCLTAWFGGRGDLDKTDLKVVKDLSLKFRGSNTWPQFRSMQPGYTPWYLSESEAKFLTVCLEQAREVALNFEKDPELLDPPGKNLYLVRVPSEKTAARSTEPSLSSSQQILFPDESKSSVHEWNSQWLSAAPRVKTVVRAFPLDEIRLQHIKKTSQGHRGAWEVDAFFTPQPAAGDDRPFFPYAFLCADQDSGFILSTVVAEPSGWETEFPRVFLESIEKHRLFPNKLCFRKEELRDLFAPLANHLGIEVEFTKRLPAVNRAKRELLKFMERGL
jgi:Domain of unknown function (DUF6930)